MNGTGGKSCLDAELFRQSRSVDQMKVVCTLKGFYMESNVERVLGKRAGGGWLYEF